MHYALTNDARFVTGPQSGDRAPSHLECETPLQQARNDFWFCPRCVKTGRLVFAEPGIRVAAPSVSEQMARRWRELPSLPTAAPAPQEPTQWQAYFDHCFPHGLLMMQAHDDAAHTIPDDTYVIVSDRVVVHNVGSDAADLTITDIHLRRPILLSQTVLIRPMEPGVVVVGNGSGRHVRLDAHVSTEERAYVRSMNE